MREPSFVFERSLAYRTREVVRGQSAGIYPPNYPTPTKDDAPDIQLAYANAAIAEGATGLITLTSSSKVVRAYARFSGVQKDDEFYVVWTGGKEVNTYLHSGDSEEPKAGQWEIFSASVTEEDPRPAPNKVTGLTCTDCYKGVRSDACASVNCCRINPIRTAQMGSIYFPAPGPFQQPILWEAAGGPKRFKHVGDCIWKTEEFAWHDPEACDGKFIWVLDRPQRKLNLEQVSGDTCKEGLVIEFEFADPEEFVDCLCVWRLKRKVWKRILAPTCEVEVAARDFPPNDLVACLACESETGGGSAGTDNTAGSDLLELKFPTEAYVRIEGHPPMGTYSGLPPRYPVDSDNPDFNNISLVTMEREPTGPFAAVLNLYGGIIDLNVDDDIELELLLCDCVWGDFFEANACIIQADGGAPYDHCVALGYGAKWANGIKVVIEKNLFGTEFRVVAGYAAHSYTLNNLGPAEGARFSSVWMNCEEFVEWLQSKEEIELICDGVFSTRYLDVSEIPSIFFRLDPVDGFASDDGRQCSGSGSDSASDSESGSDSGTEDSGTGDSGTEDSGTGEGSSTDEGSGDGGSGTDDSGTDDGSGTGTGEGSGTEDSGSGTGDSGSGTGSGDSGTGSEGEPGACCIESASGFRRCFNVPNEATCLAAVDDEDVSAAFTPGATCLDVECASGTEEDCSECFNSTLYMGSVFGNAGPAIVTFPGGGIRRWVWNFTIDDVLFGLNFDCTGDGNYTAYLFKSENPCFGYQTLTNLTVVDCDPFSAVLRFIDCEGNVYIFFIHD